MSYGMREDMRLRAGKPDYAILATTLTLVVIGLIFVYSSSFAIALAHFDNVNYFLIRQLAFALMGMMALFFFMRFDYHRLRMLSPLIMLAAVVGLAVVLVIGSDAYGSRRWIQFNSAMPPLQPSEFAKLALVIYISAWLASHHRDLKSAAAGLFPFIFVVGSVTGLILAEPDMGTAAIIAITTAMLFFIAGGSLFHIFTLGSIGAVAATLLILVGEYRSDRVFAFLAAEDDPSGNGFQVLQLLIALGSGGFEGLGLGVSRQKFFYVPGAHTDGVFAIIGEEAGVIGTLIVLGLFAYLVFRGFRVAMKSRDEFGYYLAMGITIWIGIQALINIGGVTRTIPLTGIPLPLLSYGGSSLITTMAAIGVLLNVSRYSKDQSYVDRRVRRTAAPSPKQTVRQPAARQQRPAPVES
jgi:cell division protein FtsW